VLEEDQRFTATDLPPWNFTWFYYCCMWRISF